MRSGGRSAFFGPAVLNGTVASIDKGPGWLWAACKFTIMGCIMAHHDPSNMAQRRTFMDLFSRLPGERRITRGFARVAAFEGKLAKLLAEVRTKDTELFDWCNGELARQRTEAWR